jgi:hypothetical protein
MTCAFVKFAAIPKNNLLNLIIIVITAAVKSGPPQLNQTNH